MSSQRTRLTTFVTVLIARRIIRNALRRHTHELLARFEPEPPQRSRLRRRLPLIGAVVAVGAGAAFWLGRGHGPAAGPQGPTSGV
jgi:hypothetical protein